MRLPQTCCCELQFSKQCKKKPHAVRSLQRCTLCCFTIMGMLNVLRPTAVSQLYCLPFIAGEGMVLMLCMQDAVICAPDESSLFQTVPTVLVDSCFLLRPVILTDPYLLDEFLSLEWQTLVLPQYSCWLSFQHPPTGEERVLPGGTHLCCSL